MLKNHASNRSLKDFAPDLTFENDYTSNRTLKDFALERTFQTSATGLGVAGYIAASYWLAGQALNPVVLGAFSLYVAGAMRAGAIHDQRAKGHDPKYPGVFWKFRTPSFLTSLSCRFGELLGAAGTFYILHNLPTYGDPMPPALLTSNLMASAIGAVAGSAAGGALSPYMHSTAGFAKDAFDAVRYGPGEYASADEHPPRSPADRHAKQQMKPAP